jgi:glutathione S-transferase
VNGIAAECLGDAYWFVDKARKYASERIVFNRPIGQNQGVQFPIADAYMETEAANLMPKLYIGNKNYSSWSMRPWVLLKQADIAFEEVKVRFDSFDSGSVFRNTMDALTPVGKVPLLVDDGFVVWDTLAIAEYLAEKFPDKNLWPQNTQARARARSICAEMHSGFAALRSACPMNIEASLPDMGQLIWRDKPAVRADVARIVAMWDELLTQHSGPMLFGKFSIADAYYAPVAMRLKTYALPVPASITAYISRLCAIPGVKAWMDGALAENDFIDFQEPYRTQR